jgi:hypothetical protein
LSECHSLDFAIVQRIIQLVPGLAPALNGVGDFSLTVAKALREGFGITTHFVVCSPSWAGPAEIDGFAASAAPRRDAHALASVLERACRADAARVALLQLSPYGFDANGAPGWLARALEAWKAVSPERRLLTYFHELFATSVPWRKGFWLSGLQRRATARIARASDALTTNLAQSAAWLAGVAQRGAPVEALPVVSGIGETAALPATRSPRMVVWGSASAKSAIYGQHAALLAALVREAGIDAVADVGSPTPAMPAAIAGARVGAMGVAAPERIRELLASSALGVLSYPPALLGKSSIFAAFAAHALPALVLDGGRAPVDSRDGLARGVHVLTREDALTTAPAALRALGEAAHEWYARHDAHHHAAHLARLIESCAGAP